MFYSHRAVSAAEFIEKGIWFQVNEFLNCLIDARNELLQRCVAICIELTL
jgi:hypothetical protein